MIVGGGPAGAAAAGYAARASLKTLVLDKSLMSGALALARTVANYPGVEEEISGLELLERMRRQSQRFGAEFVQTQVLGADLRGDPKKLFADRTYAGKTVIIATGASERKRKVPGEAELLGKGVSYCATCDGAFFKDEVVAAVGDNDHALEEALFLTKHASRVHLVNPAREFKAPRELAAQVLGQAKVEVHAETQFRAVEGDGAVAAIRVHPRGGQEARLPVSGVFIFLQGNAPSTEFLQGALETRESGCLVVDHNRMTSIPGVFAIGDVTCDQLKQAVVAAAEGAIAAMSADRYLNKLARAAPGRYY
ncbi:MAG: FAD-dependent oxidoreductase [Deltaproteobacteria bacterium]|nr:FAD-dependent oxidoreductase [Deltaproteobacteria bacterium]